MYFSFFELARSREVELSKFHRARNMWDIWKDVYTIDRGKWYCLPADFRTGSCRKTRYPRNVRAPSPISFTLPE